MKIVCMGDSITEGDYGVFGRTGIKNVQEKNYPYFLSAVLGCETVNKGYCGASPSDLLRLYESGNIDVSDADAVIVIIGTNGLLGLPDDEKDGKAYEKLIPLLKKDSNGRVIICTPPFATDNAKWSNHFHYAKVQSTGDFIRDYAKRTATDMIDLYACPDFGRGKEEIMQPNDGLHFGETGYYTLASYIAKELKRIMPEKF